MSQIFFFNKKQKESKKFEKKKSLGCLPGMPECFSPLVLVVRASWDVSDRTSGCKTFATITVSFTLSLAGRRKKPDDVTFPPASPATPVTSSLRTRLDGGEGRGGRDGCGERKKRVNVDGEPSGGGGGWGGWLHAADGWFRIRNDTAEVDEEGDTVDL